MQIFDSNNNDDNLFLMVYNTGNMSASLGGLLKDYRLQKNIPQMEIAFALGWKDTSRLSRIEQGIVEKPPRELIDRICQVMKLTEQEKNNLLFVGNYLPTKQEVDAVRKKLEKYIEQWPYPANIYDFCWRIILFNKKTMKILGIKNEAQRQKVYSVTPTAIEMVFDPAYVQNQHLIGKEVVVWHKNLLRFLTHFKNLQKTITKDPWYIATIKRMMNNSLFRRLWMQVERGETEFVTTRYGEKIFIHPDDTKKRLNFTIFVVPLLNDPRFELEFFNPVDEETTEFFKQ